MNRLYLLASWLTTLRSIRGLSSIVGMHRAWSARDDGRDKITKLVGSAGAARHVGAIYSTLRPSKVQDILAERGCR